MWIIDLSAGIDVVLGTDFMIPAGVRLDLLHGTARLPDEVTVPLVKSAGAADDEPYGAQVVGGPTEDFGKSSDCLGRDPHVHARVLDPKDQTNGTDGDGIPQGQARVGPLEERVGWDSPVLQASLCGPMNTQRRTPTRSGSKYNERQVLAYAEVRDETLLQKEKELYECWLAEQPPAVERKGYTTPARILARPSDDSVAPRRLVLDHPGSDDRGDGVNYRYNTKTYEDSEASVTAGLDEEIDGEPDTRPIAFSDAGMTK
ncbi:hypothetical protein PHMEG_00019049 [Phytophthora megakarya]|uniref:Eukaryotic/viral aspartic protease n=1 Tax=Phytophthora megakarya TaxID=4795 RepID=A0A225VTC1_9STRA|nr:hypothetical protein PHMEG_00019049 [Phytophthora megakarya]